MGLLGVMHITVVGTGSADENDDPAEGTIVTALCGKKFAWKRERRMYFACITCTELHMEESDLWRQAANREEALSEALTQGRAALADSESKVRALESSASIHERQIDRLASQVDSMGRALTDKTDEVDRLQRQNLGSTGISLRTLGNAVGEIYHLRAACAQQIVLLQALLAMKSTSQARRAQYQDAIGLLTGLALGTYAGDKGYQKAIADGFKVNFREAFLAVGGDDILTNTLWLEQAGLSDRETASA